MMEDEYTDLMAERDRFEAISRDLEDQLEEMTQQRDWWAGVARGFARRRSLERWTTRLLGSHLVKRQRSMVELRRTVDALVPDMVDPSL